jgi:hypothetical protein
VPNIAAASEQEVFPSAALELIVKPGGRVMVVALIADGEGTVGLCVWGMERLTSIPEGVSARLVVGVADSDGLKES